MTALRDAIDYTTLGWVKPELDETLRQARIEIEDFAADPADTSRMRFCASYLHQVQGTLRMVELYAPAMVAEEMERLAQALQDGRTTDRDGACATLMRGVVLLPDYLERLQSGHKDIPIVLLPLLNELRAARGEAGLSESVLFAPDLQRPLPGGIAPAPTTVEPAPVRNARVQPLLSGLRDAMAAWPESGAPDNAGVLAGSLDELLAQTRQEPARRMLWVASSVAKAMSDGALQAGPGLRQAFASVERESRRMFEDDGFGIPRAEAVLEPTRQLLYHVAHGSGDHEQLRALHETFELGGQLPTDSEISHAQGSLSGRNRALLDTVSAAVKEDLLRVKDALDLHLRTGEGELSRLAPQVEALGGVADTLGMLGLGVARGVIQQQRDAMAAIVRGDRAADEGALLDVAGALLYVEATLDDQVSRLGAGDEEGGDQDDLFSTESRKVLEVLVREAIANFADARQAFVAFIETSWDHAELAEVPRLLQEVSGALQMLELPVPAAYLTGVRRYTETELIGCRRVPNGRQLDTFADALASLEYYLEALRENRFNRDEILDVTRQSLETLGYWPLPAELDTGAAASPAGSGTEPQAVFSEADIERTVAALIDRDADGARAALPAPAAASEPAPAPAPAPAIARAAGGFEATGDEIDDEIREVFLEEFAEEIDNLDQLLPLWRAQPDDLERLRPIRRVFHTLKGSGRLVGARTLGEFSWKVEHMLNRVLDGTRVASPAVVAMVDQAFYTLPQLQAALRGDGPVQVDLERMQASAERIASGDEGMPEHAVPSAAAVDGASAAGDAATSALSGIDADARADFDTAAATPDDEAVAEETSGGAPIEMMPASVDALLLEILDAEVAGHLVTVDAWVARAAEAPTPASEELLRALHTMNGAFAMTEVPSVAQVVAPAEGYIRRLLAGGAPASAEGVAAIGELTEVARAALVGLHAPAPQVPVAIALAARLVSLRDALPDIRMAPQDGQAGERDADADAAADDSIAGAMQALIGQSPELVDLDLSKYANFQPTSEDAVAPDSVAADAERIETERLEAERLEAERIEAERIEAERIEAERFEAERLEAARVEAERVEIERGEAERVEAERLEAERVEAERVEAERIEAERVEAERLEAERLELERLDAERIESERLEAERAEAAQSMVASLDAGDADAGMLAEDLDASDAGRLEAERAALDALEAGLLDAERIEAERLEAERVELEQLEAEIAAEERAEAERVEAERLEAARVEAESAEAERAEAERADAERVAAERAEAERLELEQLEAEIAAADQAEAERLDAERAEAERLEAERLDAEAFEAEELEAANDGRHDVDPAVAALLAAIALDHDPDAAFDFTGLDPELIDIFVEESRDLLDHSDGLLARLREAPGDRDPVVGMQRDLHTLKGGARMAGVFAIGELGHAMESLLEAVAEQRFDLGRGDVPLLERGFDRLHAMVLRVGEGRAISASQALIDAFDARARGDDLATHTAAADAVRVPAPKVELRPLSAPISNSPLGGDDDDIAVRAPQEQVRIRADLLDRLVNYAGEVAIYRARLEQQLGAFRGAMGEMEQTNMRLRDQLRRLDIETEAQIVARYQREQDTGDATFDPLELDRFSTLQQLSRALGESAADLTSLQGTLDDLTRQYETLLLQQSRVSSELQEGLMRTRMVPFDGLVPRLRRVVRQAAGDTGKHVQLKLDGAHGELDRNVLERMTAPLEHMLRNAVAHGLESPKQRRKARKAEEGTVRIAVRREGSEVVLEVGDDGDGLDRAAIRRRGEERGLLRPDAVIADADLDMLIFEPGFSTVDEVSRLAGRGVGMDVVASEVRQLGGTLDIRTRKGEGTTFILRLPQTLAVTQAVFVKIGDTSFAVPIASVRGVGRIARDEFEKPGASYSYGGEDYIVHDLGGLVGHGAAKAEGQMQMPVLLVRSGELRAAVAVDQIIGSREIVVKPVGPQVASIPGIFGATIMGDGGVVVILDVAPLVRRQVTMPRDAEPVVAQEQRPVPLVMVVDDSITMRKVTGRILERHNFEVATAKDGLDALERMAERVPDLMLLDIEMPRMDGYELATEMKADPRLRNVPIVMITSRTSEKHRQRAFEIGVDRYLGKPYQENELVRNVYDLLKLKREDA
ncbi:Hpt domain-containing protein [Luteimonas sp. MC1572]|uniref:Hpt domain-containing protein n=1 Tax=Luteimonas sp. MC1572 TaxID=2799325 RepID=UPI0018F08816|nr:Hpt domain-containing protein [Luteimonas sp. MC1572]MBJ6981300.1 Hpt domain-containing protein [Luteimonas sp. MC1572]QQO02620.1 Hpt domain-containing protein [Luteimonas sp. MC1572]